MANKTIADRVLEAVGTGKEVKFHATDATSSGTEYEFTPAGLATYISTDSGVLTATDASAIAAVTAANIVVDGTDGLAAGTIQEALQALDTRVAVLEP